jgi:hypothetical protein
LANVKRANALGITKAGTGISDVPDAPTIGTATGGAGAATVTYTAAATGGTATTFTATSSPGSVTGTGASPITVEGLTNGTAYTFTVTATNSTGTSPASAATASVTPINLGNMEAIAMIEVGSAGAANIEFTSIPDTYKHLQIRFLAKTVYTASNQDGINVQYNGATGSSYNYHYLGGNGSGSGYSGAGGSSAQTFMQTVSIAATSSNANVFGVGVIDILDYANTSKYKVQRGLGGVDQNGSGVVEMWSGLYLATTAISSIKLYSYNGFNFSQYSSFALYGIKG